MIVGSLCSYLFGDAVVIDCVLIIRGMCPVLAVQCPSQSRCSVAAAVVCEVPLVCRR